MKDLIKKVEFNPSFNSTLIFALLIFAIIILFLFKYSLIYQAASNKDWGAVAALELPSLLSTLSSPSSISFM